MARYGIDYGRSPGRYGADRGYDRWYTAASEGFRNAPFRRGGYDRGMAVSRQLREEHRFQAERAAPGTDLELEEGYGSIREQAGRRARGGGAGVCAADLMTEDPEAVTPDTTLAEAAKKMRDLDVGILPVVDDAQSRRLQGVITDRDITVRAVAEGKGARTKVRTCMTTGVEACHPDDRVRDVLHVMEREQVRRVPITDHDGSLVGIIAQADLAVDYAYRHPDRELRVEEAIERISEPARPRRGGMRRG